MTLAAFIDRSARDREQWKYTDLERILPGALRLAESFKPSPLFLQDKGKPAHRRIVFCNGVWDKELSDPGIASLGVLKGDLDSGYVFSIKGNAKAERPFELVFSTDDRAPKEISIKLSIKVAEGAALDLLENYVATNVPTTVETDIVLSPRASLTHAKIVEGEIHLSSCDARLAANCSYNNFSLIRSSILARNEILVSLEGENADATLGGIALLDEREHADMTTCVTHKAPRCASRQSYRSILDGKSRGAFQGRIVVEKNAQKTDAYQLSRALLLSDKAEMDAKPELRIFADDVKCSHGNAIGDLDEEALYYLRARGIGERQARGLLIEGFVAEALESVKIEAWRDLFTREVTKGMK